MTDPTSRALRLLGLLQSRAAWTGPELAVELGVTTRTLRRDVERLRDLGYTVDAEPGVGGGYAVGRGRVIPPLLLAQDEAVAVTLALVGAAAHGAVGDGQASLRALGKLDDVLPGPLREQVRGLRDAVVVASPRTLGPVVDSGVLATCAEAVRRRLRLRFDYVDRLGRATQRSVEPHLLAARGPVWRLACWDVDRGDWRTFRLDRMAAVELTTWAFRPRAETPQVEELLVEPMPLAAYRHEVVVRVTCPADVLAAALPPGAGLIEPAGEGRCELSSGADDPDDAAWWLAALGHEFEVLGDDAVRAAVARLGQRLRRAARGA